MTIAELASSYSEIVDLILAAGPDIQANLDDLKIAVDALRRIRSRVLSRFGGVAAEESVDVLAGDPKVVAANERLSAAVGVSGPFTDMLLQLMQFAMNNPVVLQMILSLLKRPA